MSKRSVAVLVMYNQKGEILLQHRSSDAQRYPDYWAFFGGGIEQGEEPEDAVKREILEELEYVCSNPILVHRQSFTNNLAETGDKFAYVSLYDDSQPLVQHEGQGLGWFSASEIPALKTIPHDASVFEAAIEYVRSLK